MNRCLNIMIIEDDTTTCRHFTDYIEQYDDLSITTITNNSYRAIELLQEQLPEAIILDLELNEGKGNGLLFLQELKRNALPFKPLQPITPAPLHMIMCVSLVQISLCPSIRKIILSIWHLTFCK